MNPSPGARQPIVRRFLREVAIGYGLFSTRDPEEWKPYFEDLGKLCAEAWHDDLPEEDRAWAAARRERFRKWVEGPGPNGTAPQATASALQSGHSAVPGRFTPRERAIRALPDAKDRNEWALRKQELLEIYASAWREDVPDEDREWAQAYRDCCTGHVNGRRRDAIARSAYESYLQSSGGVFDGAPGRTWPNHTGRELEPWRAFAERVDDAPEGESELETAEAAARAYWDTLYRDAPPWDSDPDRAHWLAAARAARAKALAGDELPKRRWLR